MATNAAAGRTEWNTGAQAARSLVAKGGQTVMGHDGKDLSTNELFQRVRARLRAAVGEDVFNSWFTRLDLEEVVEDLMLVGRGKRRSAKRLSKSGAWVYLDAGHSNWTPYDTRPRFLKASGVRFARGISTNVSNFRPTADEKRYATTLLAGLRRLGVKGKHYVIDTSRNGAAPSDDRVINPPWARLGKRPKLVFKGAFDGTLWVKHPGESDGWENGGNGSGQWCDLLADRLLGSPDTGQGC
jgi:hypothetical protein